VKSGPSESADSSPSPEPRPPGEFVSEELQIDCARFLDELRALLRHRREQPPGRTAWTRDDRVE